MSRAATGSPTSSAANARSATTASHGVPRFASACGGPEVVGAQQRQPHQSSAHDDRELRSDARRRQQHDGCERRDGHARLVRRERPRHAPQRQRDDGNGHDLQSVQPARVGLVAERLHPVREQDERGG